ncbi:replication initiation protein [Chitinimonas lacunae]|uniref:Replication initiation protein n=1 Tax=Chitinimonas lacunae TaxID=1963018 RepID=A0ABV8MX32_9NEIS
MLDEAPYFPRCSDNKTAALVRPREYAIRRSYMQVNRGGMVSWLVFDLDHDNPWIWADTGLREPNLIVSDPKTCRSQLFYAISPVCTSERAQSRPIAYMRSVYEAMAIRLQADLAYSGPVAKTPGHPAWKTTELHSHVYDLAELAETVELTSAPPWGKGPQLDLVVHSRHCLLFEQLRHFAYGIVNRERANGSFSSFCRLVEAQAHALNNFRRRGFSVDLPLSSIRATVRSITRWTWDRYTGSGKPPRVMQLDPDLSIVERQRLAATRTHEQRRTTTAERIAAACRQLVATGERVTLTAVAKIAGVVRQTVAAYRDLLELPQVPSTEPLQEEKVTHQQNVKNAVYQISAVQSAGRVFGETIAISYLLPVGLPLPDL